MRRALLLPLLIICGAAQAQITPANPWFTSLRKGAAYVGPGDIASYLVWGGFSCYSAAVAATGTQKALRIRRASDNAESDILCLSTGAIDVATMTTFCNATSCFLKTVYNQTGATPCAGSTTCDGVQATAGNQPPIVFNCLGSMPCAQVTTNTQVLSSTTNYTPVGPIGLSAVANRVSGTGLATFVRMTPNADRLFSTSAQANKWSMTGTSGPITVTANDNTWHAANGTMTVSGTGSALNIDGVETAGAATVTTTAGTPWFLNGAVSTTTNWLESGFWDGAIAWNSTQRSALNFNEHQRYGF